MERAEDRSESGWGKRRNGGLEEVEKPDERSERRCTSFLCVWRCRVKGQN